MTIMLEILLLCLVTASLMNRVRAHLVPCYAKRESDLERGL
jgi:hypothetical protein